MLVDLGEKNTSKKDLNIQLNRTQTHFTAVVQQRSHAQSAVAVSTSDTAQYVTVQSTHGEWKLSASDALHEALVLACNHGFTKAQTLHLMADVTARGGSILRQPELPSLQLQNRGLSLGVMSWDPWVVHLPHKRIRSPCTESPHQVLTESLLRRVYYLFQAAGDAPPGKQFWAFSRLGTAWQACDIYVYMYIF